jgi:hypothetical protein
MVDPVTTTAATTVSTDVDNKGTIVNKTIDITNDPSAKLLEPTWMTLWREVLAYVFAAIITFDFIVGPIATMFVDAYFKTNLPAWSPLTLQGGGLFYVAMAAILGTAAYGSMVKSRELIRNLPDLSHQP